MLTTENDVFKETFTQELSLLVLECCTCMETVHKVTHLKLL